MVVGQVIQYPAGGKLSVGRMIEHGKERHQFCAAGNCVEVQQLFVLELLFEAREAMSACLIDQDESEKGHGRSGEEQDSLWAACLGSSVAKRSSFQTALFGSAARRGHCLPS